MNRSLLEQPFEAGQIKQRRGLYGPLDYVEGHSVIARLNQALEGVWSFEITYHDVRDDEVIVLGKLTAENVVKTQFGVSQITRKEGGAVVSLGDDLKAAATDALKKCATFLGVALHLYADKPIGGRAPAARVSAGPPRTPDPPTNAGTPEPPPPGSPGTNGHVATNGTVPGAGNRATQRQLDTIVKIALAKGLKPGEIDGVILRKFNRKPAALTTREASALIQELSNLTRAAS